MSEQTNQTTNEGAGAGKVDRQISSPLDRGVMVARDARGRLLPGSVLNPKGKVPLSKLWEGIMADFATGNRDLIMQNLVAMSSNPDPHIQKIPLQLLSQAGKINPGSANSDSMSDAPIKVAMIEHNRRVELESELAALRERMSIYERRTIDANDH